MVAGTRAGRKKEIMKNFGIECYVRWNGSDYGIYLGCLGFTSGGYGLTAIIKLGKKRIALDRWKDRRYIGEGYSWKLVHD